MADSTKETLKQKFDSICKYEQIRKDISQENVTELSKDRVCSRDVIKFSNPKLESRKKRKIYTYLVIFSHFRS